MPIISGGSGGSGAVNSVFGRSGAVLAVAGDYTAALVTGAADKSSMGTQTFAGNVETPELVVDGIAGITSQGRLSGYTASGSPVLGSWLAGDVVWSLDGNIYVCTVGGTPGIWVAVGAGGSLVSSVFGRQGAVVAAGGDYVASQVTHAADLSSTTLQAFAAGISSDHPSQGIGYATGAGGTVTQASTRNTAVTINKTTGQITTNGTSLGVGGIAVFTVNNSTVAATDVIALSITNSVTTTTQILYAVSAVASGSFQISYYNNGTGATTVPYVFNFVVLKGVAS